MSNPVSIENIGAYSQPYSGIGIPYEPLGISSTPDAPVLHEAGYIPNNAHWNFPNVLSPFWRIYHNADAGHCILIDGQLIELLSNRIIMIPDHILFHCLGELPARCFWLHFSMPRRVSTEQPVPIMLEPDEENLSLIQSISKYIQADKRPTDAILHRSMALIHLLFAKAEIRWAGPLPDALKSLLKFIEQHAYEKLPNRELATRAGMSIETLSRLFRKHLHTSPAQYINQIRISQAGQLLEQTSLSIEQIAEQTGFPNRAYFSRVFKQISTLSPAAFREQKQKHRSLFEH